VTEETATFSWFPLSNNVYVIYKKKNYRTANIIVKNNFFDLVILLYYILICY